MILNRFKMAQFSKLTSRKDQNVERFGLRTHMRVCSRGAQHITGRCRCSEPSFGPPKKKQKFQHIFKTKNGKKTDKDMILQE